MIGYVTVGSNDLAKAASFYDALFAELGAGRFMEEETFIAWAVSPDKPAFSISRPFDSKPATVGNGVMIAFALETPAQVKALYGKAIALGATCDGKPGSRIDDVFYGAYVRDADGNKLCFFDFS